MKRNGSLFLLVSLFFLSFRMVSAQISHGGSPFFLPPTLPPTPLKGESGTADFSSFRGSGGSGMFEMPAFNLDSIMQENQPDEKNMQRSYPFAYKFFTNIEMKRDAALTVLPDGTKVWQINIRSQGAYSINVLLTDFELPPGGKLFVYNADHSHVIGSFDYRNNSPEKILPIQPVAGESIIIEYSEPANVPFEGNFTVSEVNHDYRDILRREPGNDSGVSLLCMPDALCSGADKDIVRSTVLLIINGSTACTGVLVNNTENDGTPYLLTAVHCLNDSLQNGVSKNMDFYIARSGTIISFFNYDRPVCGSRLKGTEEMTMAEAYPRTIIEKKDVALLELRENPPVYYNVYYAGWNMDESGGTGKHVNLHHPSADIKRYGAVDADLLLASYPSYPPNIFDPASHWKIPGWTTGSTAAGSSGSPLFDQNGLLIGTLTGGNSYCSGSSPNGSSDYFTALYKSWETTDANNQLKTYLDSNNKGLKQQPGMDPNMDNPLARLSNIDFSAGDTLIVSTLNSPNSGYVFGSNNLIPTSAEFAEEFTTDSAIEILGAYLFVPPLSANGITGVKISVYSGTNSPETLLQTQDFSPRYLSYSSSGGFVPLDKNMKSFGTESFVLFADSVKIAKGKFFISYKINKSSIPFCVYNAKFAGADKQNTAWVRDSLRGWIPATSYSPALGVKTSLAVQPLVRSTILDSLPYIPGEKNNPLFFDSKKHLLSLREPAGEPIAVNIYSLTGSLMEKVQFNKGEKSVPITPKIKGTIGIVQLKLSSKIYSQKIIY